VISYGTDFQKARAYYAMFSLTPARMIDMVRGEGSQFSFDEYKAMLNLQSGVDQSQPEDERGGSYYRLQLLDLEALTIGAE